MKAYIKSAELREDRPIPIGVSNDPVISHGPVGFQLCLETTQEQDMNEILAVNGLFMAGKFVKVTITEWSDES